MFDKSIEDSLWAREVRDASNRVIGHRVFCDNACVSRFMGMTIEALETTSFRKYVYPYESDCAEWCFHCGRRCNLGDERCTEDCLKPDNESLIEVFVCKHGYPDRMPVSRSRSLRNRIILTQPFVEWMIAKEWGVLLSPDKFSYTVI